MAKTRYSYSHPPYSDTKHIQRKENYSTTPEIWCEANAYICTTRTQGDLPNIHANNHQSKNSQRRTIHTTTEKYNFQNAIK